MNMVSETQVMCVMMLNFKMVSTFYCQLVACLVAQSVRNLPAMQETRVRFLGQEDPLVKVLQYSCLENPMDRGVQQAVLHGVAGQTRLSD